MGLQFLSSLVVGLLLGIDPVTPTGNVANAQIEGPKATVAVTENATITIAPGTKMSVRTVKTGQGMRVRLEMPGVAIEAVRLRMESNGIVTDIQIGQDGAMQVSTVQQER